MRGFIWQGKKWLFRTIAINDSYINDSDESVKLAESFTHRGKCLAVMHFEFKFHRRRFLHVICFWADRISSGEALGSTQ